MAFHRVLQLLALKVVQHLVWRRLSHVQDGLTGKMLRLDLVTHLALPVREGRDLDGLTER